MLDRGTCLVPDIILMSVIVICKNPCPNNKSTCPYDSQLTRSFGEHICSRRAGQHSASTMLPTARRSFTARYETTNEIRLYWVRAIGSLGQGFEAPPLHFPSQNSFPTPPARKVVGVISMSGFFKPCLAVHAWCSSRLVCFACDKRMSNWRTISTQGTEHSSSALGAVSAESSVHSAAVYLARRISKPKSKLPRGREAVNSRTVLLMCS